MLVKESPGGARNTPEPGPQKRRTTVDERSIEYGEVRGGDQGHPHVCWDGYVYLGYTAIDEETGDEVERVEALPCRRCAEEA